jgi:hypothetical protein
MVTRIFFVRKPVAEKGSTVARLKPDVDTIRSLFLSSEYAHYSKDNNHRINRIQTLQPLNIFLGFGLAKQDG